MSTHKLSTRRLIAATATFAALLAVATTSASALPDNRAWEMVSPLQKGGGEIKALRTIGLEQASPNGEKVTFSSTSAFPGAQGAPIVSQYIATRNSTEGWLTENIAAPTNADEYPLVGDFAPYKAFSETLSSALLWLGAFPETSDPLTQYQRLHLRNSATGEFEGLLVSTPLGADGEPVPPGHFALEYAGSTPDLRNIALETAAALTAGARVGTEGIEEPNLYEWSDGHLYAINQLPGATGGETTPPAVIGSVPISPESHSISADGSRVFWSPRDLSALYVREGIGSATERTVAIAGHGHFRDASVTGSRVFFTDPVALVGQASPEDLYEYAVESETLKDLSLDTNPADAEGANVQGVVGVGGEGAYVYFVANGVLTNTANARGEYAKPGNCKGRGVGVSCNLYLVHDGETTFIATMSPADGAGFGGSSADWDPAVARRTARVSVDGLHMVFISKESLTGADTAGEEQVYLYDAGSARLRCVSCNPSGARSTGRSTIPAGTEYTSERAVYQSRVLSEGLPGDGERVFFDSNDALVPQDTDGREDAYEWETLGTGSCTTTDPGYSAASGGCTSLISGGSGNSDSSFLDASVTGDNVFFTTGQQLVSQDTDELVDLYDARENGGLPAPPAPPVCSGTACQGVPPAPPIFATPASVTFSGEGNFAAAMAAKKAVVKSEALTRAQKLAKALKACRAKRGKARSTCEKGARRKYGAVKRRK